MVCGVNTFKTSKEKCYGYGFCCEEGNYLKVIKEEVAPPDSNLGFLSSVSTFLF